MIRNEPVARIRTVAEEFERTLFDIGDERLLRLGQVGEPGRGIRRRDAGRAECEKDKARGAGFVELQPSTQCGQRHHLKPIDSLSVRGTPVMLPLGLYCTGSGLSTPPPPQLTR